MFNETTQINLSVSNYFYLISSKTYYKNTFKIKLIRDMSISVYNAKFLKKLFEPPNLLKIEQHVFSIFAFKWNKIKVASAI